jgi:hypothetical protein
VSQEYSQSVTEAFLGTILYLPESSLAAGQYLQSTSVLAIGRLTLSIDCVPLTRPCRASCKIRFVDWVLIASKLPCTRTEPIVGDFHLQMTWYVVGHRAWLGHKKRVTIPLWRLPGIENGDWEMYQSELRRWDFYGAPRNRTAEPFAVPVYGNPVPNCMCQPKGGPLPFNSRTCKSDAYKCIDER